jgi:hypothetical protein
MDTREGYMCSVALDDHIHYTLVSPSQSPRLKLHDDVGVVAPILAHVRL